jgi:hypothetical protein
LTFQKNRFTISNRESKLTLVTSRRIIFMFQNSKSSHFDYFPFKFLVDQVSYKEFPPLRIPNY